MVRESACEICFQLKLQSFKSVNRLHICLTYTSLTPETCSFYVSEMLVTSQQNSNEQPFSLSFDGSQVLYDKSVVNGNKPSERITFNDRPSSDPLPLSAVDHCCLWTACGGPPVSTILKMPAIREKMKKMSCSNTQAPEEEPALAQVRYGTCICR